MVFMFCNQIIFEKDGEKKDLHTNFERQKQEHDATIRNLNRQLSVLNERMDEVLLENRQLMQLLEEREKAIKNLQEEHHAKQKQIQ